ncbi:MAG TPA: DUF4230 domain-containing protein [Sedimentisphaerales bacterium]|nr:DUF4230 domain-containing protein [Sedimentisphaerales bacterium]
MEEMVVGIILGLVAAGMLFGWLWLRKRVKTGRPPLNTRVRGSIEDIRSVGELVVFKIVTKEIVTAADHWFGEWGKKYFQWLASAKKMAMIFEFEVNFRYDLRSSDFVIEHRGNANYRLKMPKCLYETYIRDISFYDEQSSRFLPWLLPDLVSRVFGTGFDETDKNHLKEEAKQQAGRMAKSFVEKMQSEVQNSARQTLEALGKAFGARDITVDFTDSRLVQTKVESAA